MAGSSDGVHHRVGKTQDSYSDEGKSDQKNKFQDVIRHGFFGAGFSNFATPGTANQSPENVVDPPYRTAGEYAHAVQTWIWQYYYWSSMNNFYMSSFPFYCMGYGSGQPAFSSLPNLQGPSTSIPDHFGPQAGQQGPRNGHILQHQAEQPPVAPHHRPVGQEYRIPPIWKRVVAEVIDFLLLLLIKVGVTCILVDYTETISDIQPFDVEQFLMKGEIDIDRMLSLTTEIIIMEVINRIFISIYEALCLRHGIRTIGGSTPGKKVMGLCLVSCDEVVELPDGKVQVIPAQNVGFWNALVRSVIKNFSLAFLFPMCFTALFFMHGRAAYDIISKSIVVESNDDLAIRGQR